MRETTPKLGLYLPAESDGEDNGQIWAEQVNENFRRLDGVLMAQDAFLPERSSASVTTTFLDAGASEVVTLMLSRSAHILIISTDYPAWVRVYSSAAAREADASRPSNSYPQAGKGVVADTITSNGDLAIDQDPCPFFAKRDASDGAAYLTITNLDAVPRAITCTISFLPAEN